MPTESPSEHRRTTRILLRIPITLSGANADGSNFSEDTETVSVSKHGTAVRTRQRLTLGHEASVRTKNKNRAGQFEVVWIGKPGTESEGLVGLEWLEARRFWGLEFPPDDWSGD